MQIIFFIKSALVLTLILTQVFRVCNNNSINYYVESHTFSLIFDWLMRLAIPILSQALRQGCPRLTFTKASRAGKK